MIKKIQLISTTQTIISQLNSQNTKMTMTCDVGETQKCGRTKHNVIPDLIYVPII